jgi:hypothetical protein
MMNYPGPSSPSQFPGSFTPSRQEMQLSADLNRRKVPSVRAPAMFNPSDSQFFLPNGLPNHYFLKDFLYDEGRLTEEQALYILKKATDMLSQEPNLLDIASPLTSEPLTVFTFCLWMF